MIHLHKIWTQKKEGSSRSKIEERNKFVNIFDIDFDTMYKYSQDNAFLFFKFILLFHTVFVNIKFIYFLIFVPKNEHLYYMSLLFF